ncbi:hypothetical protein FGO68_gene16927 [Halteria grandinella]|uniref:Uncharacterized protein n=1 Tax=Halteria grandinella TaxID=5974 RepID=A0A8J8T293_HALGN|nr:hypothetical protein FGO68_gene16927 [Halteria grandinella]
MGCTKTKEKAVALKPTIELSPQKQQQQIPIDQQDYVKSSWDSNPQKKPSIPLPPKESSRKRSPIPIPSGRGTLNHSEENTTVLSGGKQQQPVKQSAIESQWNNPNNHEEVPQNHQFEEDHFEQFVGETAPQTFDNAHQQQPKQKKKKPFIPAETLGYEGQMVPPPPSLPPPINFKAENQDRVRENAAQILGTANYGMQHVAKNTFQLPPLAHQKQKRIQNEQQLTEDFYKLLNNKHPSNLSDPNALESVGKLSMKTHANKREDLENLLSELREQSADDDSFRGSSSRINLASPKNYTQKTLNKLERNDTNRAHMGSNSSFGGGGGADIPKINSGVYNPHINVSNQYELGSLTYKANTTKQQQNQEFLNGSHDKTNNSLHDLIRDLEGNGSRGGGENPYVDSLMGVHNMKGKQLLPVHNQDAFAPSPQAMVNIVSYGTQKKASKLRYSMGEEDDDEMLNF